MDIQRLPELQTAIKKTPDLYLEDVAAAYQCFRTLLDHFPEEPSARHEDLGCLSTFLCQVSPYFVLLLKQLPSELLNILDNYYSALHPEFRRAVFSGLVLMRNREQIAPMAVLPTSFRMFRCADKALREQAFSFIVCDIKRINTPNLQPRLNHQILTFVASMLSDSNLNAAKKSLHVLMTVYKRKIIHDSRLVNTITQACLCSEAKIATAGALFLISADDDAFDSSSESEDEEPNPHIVGKRKSKGAVHEKEREIKNFEKRKRRRERAKTDAPPSFLCVDQLKDPQDFVEKVFANVLKNFNKGKFKARVTLLHLIVRIIGRHKLFLMDLYPYLLKYIRPRTNYVSQVLVIVSEAVHDLLPPEELEPLFKKLLHEFISDNCSEETITLGLNTAREICRRQPLVMTKDIMQDLSGFRVFRNKAVVMAAKSLINLFRELNPTVLQGKDRMGSGGFELQRYAAQTPAFRVPGAELLEKADEVRENYSRQTVFCRQQLAVSDNYLKLLKHKEKLGLEKEEEEREECEMREAAREEDLEEEFEDEFEGSEESDQSDNELSEVDEDEQEDQLEPENSEEEESESIEESKFAEEPKVEVSATPSGLPSEQQSDAPMSESPPLPFECDQILSQHDFSRIRTLQRMIVAKKRRAEVPVELLESDSESDGPHHFVEDDDIATFRRPKNERIEEKRLEKEKFKQREKKGGPTQHEHDKHKPTMMVLPKLKRDMKSELATVRKQLKNVKKQFRGHFSKRFKQNF